MVRATLWAVLACAAVSACGTKDSAPAAQPGAVAGKVLEVAGSVKVGAKQLAVGDPVKTDDVIETGADGNVAIELAHNGARWELGPNQKLRPTESIAWKQERHGSAAQVDQDTSAAGRPAERSAADTATSAAKAESAPAPSAAAPPTAPPAAAAAPQRAAVAMPEPAAEPPPPPPPPAKTKATADVASGDAAPQAERSRAAIGGASTGGAPGGGGGAAVPTADLFASLASCVPAGSRTHVTIHVANHVAAIKFDKGASATGKKCMTAAAKKLSISVASGELSLTLEH